MVDEKDRAEDRARRKAIGQRLEAAREMGGLTARALGKLAGKSPGLVRHVERGEHAPGAKTLEKWAGILSVSLDWLVLGDLSRAPDPAQVRAVAQAAWTAYERAREQGARHPAPKPAPKPRRPKVNRRAAVAGV